MDKPTLQEILHEYKSAPCEVKVTRTGAVLRAAGREVVLTRATRDNFALCSHVVVAVGGGYFANDALDKLARLMCTRQAVLGYDLVQPGHADSDDADRWWWKHVTVFLLKAVRYLFDNGHDPDDLAEYLTRYVRWEVESSLSAFYNESLTRSKIFDYNKLVPHSCITEIKASARTVRIVRSKHRLTESQIETVIGMVTSRPDLAYFDIECELGKVGIYATESVISRICRERGIYRSKPRRAT
jgi:hypothetical protein